MTYVGNNYTATDVAPVTADLIVTIISGLVGFASLIAIILLFKFLKGKKIGL
jgi:hypothetical protein